jgi:LmbE family N-acetylglucosaminyl deacetylase
MPTLAVIFAHPDDETFATGATLARCAAGGVRTALYVATDGDAGKSSGIAVASREELGALRRRELAAACAILGVPVVRHGGHPDGALGTVDADALIGELVDFLREQRPDVVVTFGPEGAPTGHRDHQAISRAATAAFFLAGLASAYPAQLAGGRGPHRARRLYYVSWDPPMPERNVHQAGLPIAARIDTRPWLDTKRRAFDAHRTQHMHRDQFEATLRDDEPFALASGRQPRDVVDDLFEGV